MAHADSGSSPTEWPAPVVVAGSGPGAMRGRKMSLSTSVVPRPNTAPAAVPRAGPARPGSPSRRTDDLARPWTQGDATKDDTPGPVAPSSALVELAADIRSDAHHPSRITSQLVLPRVELQISRCTLLYNIDKQ